MGVIPGTLILGVCAIATLFSLRLLVNSADTAYRNGSRPWNQTPLLLKGEPSYGSIGHACLGEPGAFISDLILAVSCFGFAASCLVEIGDCMPRLAYELFGPRTILQPFYIDILYDRDFWIFLSYILLIPVCLTRHVDDYAWYSVLCGGAAVYLIVMVLMLTLFVPPIIPTAPPISTTAYAWTRCIPIFVFSFACHQNLYSVYYEMDALFLGDPHTSNTTKRLNRVILYAVILCSGVYLLVGWLGFRSFGSMTEVVILNNFKKGVPLTVARILFSILAGLTFPLQLHPCRASLDNCWHCFYKPLMVSKDTYDVDAPSGQRHSFKGFLTFLTDTEPGRRAFLTLLLMGLAYFTAIQIDRIDKILLFVGATGGMIVCFILPAVFYVSLNPSLWKEQRSAQLIGSLGLIAFGLVFGFLQLVVQG